MSGSVSSPFQPNLLAGKTALITGAGSGINKGIALHFSRHGANLVLVGRRQEKLDATAAEIAAMGGKALGCSADVRDYDALAAAAAKGANTFGPYDIVIAGAAASVSVNPTRNCLFGSFRSWAIMSSSSRRGRPRARALSLWS